MLKKIIIAATITLNIFTLSYATDYWQMMTSPTIKSDISTNSVTSNTNTEATKPKEASYIQVINSCNHNHSGTCVSVRSEPSVKSKKVNRLRTGVVLRVKEVVKNEGHDWYKVDFDSERVNKRYRLTSDWYIRSDLVKLLPPMSAEVYDESNPPADTNKKILINLKSQTLEAYEGDKLFMKSKISSGTGDDETKSGEYYVYYKTPSRYMQDGYATTTMSYFDSNSSSTITYSTSTKGLDNYKGYYDLPGVPFDMYFDTDGKAIHGAYWHNNFGRTHSHGCINLPLKEAEKLYNWAPLGIPVLVK